MKPTNLKDLSAIHHKYWKSFGHFLIQDLLVWHILKLHAIFYASHSDFVEQICILHERCFSVNIMSGGDHFQWYINQTVWLLWALLFHKSMKCHGLTTFMKKWKRKQKFLFLRWIRHEVTLFFNPRPVHWLVYRY